MRARHIGTVMVLLCPSPTRWRLFSCRWRSWRSSARRSSSPRAYFLGLRGGFVVALWATLRRHGLLPQHPSREMSRTTSSPWSATWSSACWWAWRWTGSRARSCTWRKPWRRRGWRASSSPRARAATACSSRRAPTPCTCTGSTHAGEPTRFLAVNNATCALLGYTREELRGLTPRSIDAAPAPGQLRRMMAELCATGTVHYESVRRTRDGELIPVEISSSLTEVEGDLVVLSISRDISARQREVRRLQELTLRDELTGLLNRRGLDVMLPEQAEARQALGPPGHRRLRRHRPLQDAQRHLWARARRRGTGRGRRCAAGGLPRDRPDRPPRRRRVLRDRRGRRHRSSPARGAAGRSRAGRRRALGMRVGLSHGEVTTDWHGLEDPRAALAEADERMYAAKHARGDDCGWAPGSRMAPRT